MNKYQEALNRFKAYKNICIHSRFYEDIDTLQELIDDYDYMKNDVELAKERNKNVERKK